ncbi:TM0106 family RecB-like putative nuclease [Pseudidiomarina insulisalsae]|uniref:Helicase n=1 Tax=Pseudidiomarina insulisalsae TaxID=575789 RepID=A0A432YMQ0_9GAMM|nr:TM0106 family RecB-like putative nuclease [Pseudidiomarina insulisalsae]RUO62216.1 helicase [Pseudidiomarina insulisalsae]
MRQLNGQTFYSPSDLTEFHDSPFASWCKLCHRATGGEFPTPDPEDAFLKMLQDAGEAHELGLVKQLHEEGRNVVDVKKLCPGSDFLKQHQETVRLMKEGAEIIFQAALMDEPFAGYADFVVRVNTPSDLGEHSYEVWDTKLSKTAKVTHLLQLVAYAQMLEKIQGHMPNTVTVVLGSGAFESYPTAEYLPYFSVTKEKFIAAATNFDQDAMPDPFESREYGSWSTFAEALLAERRHLSLVANIRRSQIVKLNSAGILTIDELAELSDLSQVKIPNATLEKLREQAQVQIATEQAGTPQYRLRSPKPNEPELFSMLAPFSSGDIYFDLEGDPLTEGSLEFLWGMTVFDDNGKQDFIAYWAHNQEEEKQALAKFFELTLARWQRYPQMRVYHYAPYEMTALKRLVARYGIYENELDEMLRAELFVDLYKVVKSTLIIVQPSYSIKKVELFYRDARDTEIGLGGDAVVAYQQWTELGDKTILDAIELYNKDDCDSTYELAQWLRGLQAMHRSEIAQAAHDVADKEGAAEREKKPDDNLATKQALQKLADAQSDELERYAIETLMYLIDFHAREDKPKWWQFFEWLNAFDEELIEERNVIIDCNVLDRSDVSLRIRCNTEQEMSLSMGAGFALKMPEFPELSGAVKGKVSELFDDETFELKMTGNGAEQAPDQFTLVSQEFVPTGPLKKSLVELAEQVVRQKALPDDVAIEIIKRAAPRFSKALDTLSANRCSQNERVGQIAQLVEHLDRSYLTVQGPPGTGKTYTAARVIGHLMHNYPQLAIGITSNSHKALNNLLKKVAEYCAEQGIACTFYTSKLDEELEALGVDSYEQNTKAVRFVRPNVVMGGTAWVFSRKDMANTLDYLFIDEAGQVALANVIAMAQSTRNIVLLGDQMQLGQPTQATHPLDSGLSALDYLMKHEQVVPEDKGVLLNRSYRMHHDVLGFISSMVYQGRLEADDANKNQRIDVTSNDTIKKKSGIEFHPVEHDGNTVASDEEADYIQQLYQQLLQAHYTDKNDKQQLITSDAILIVTPYNLQVQRLKQRLPKGARVGTVDKFQGQEAPVVIFSFCSSSPDESPRGLDFLFDIRRINVAVSRAQALAIVVGSPRLLDVCATSIPLMKKASLVAELGRVGR